MGIQVLLLSRDATVRSTLARLLEREPGLSVSEAPERTPHPDVVVFNATDHNSIQEVRRQYPRSRIVATVSVLKPYLRGSSEIDRTLDNITPYDQLLQVIHDLAALGPPAP